jgi:hypothetical protein
MVANGPPARFRAAMPPSGVADRRVLHALIILTSPGLDAANDKPYDLRLSTT